LPQIGDPLDGHRQQDESEIGVGPTAAWVKPVVAPACDGCLHLGAYFDAFFHVLYFRFSTFWFIPPGYSFFGEFCLIPYLSCFSSGRLFFGCLFFLVV
jgi:hypothetical protein